MKWPELGMVSIFWILKSMKRIKRNPKQKKINYLIMSQLNTEQLQDKSAITKDYNNDKNDFNSVGDGIL